MRTTYVRAVRPDSGEGTIWSVVWAVCDGPFDTNDSDVWPYQQSAVSCQWAVKTPTVLAEGRQLKADTWLRDQAEPHGYRDCFGSALHAQ